MNQSINQSINNKQTSYEYAPDSIWSNIKYLTGMLAAIIIPPLIPGVTTRHLIISYASITLGVYVLAFVIKLVITIKQNNTPQTRRH